MKTLFALIFLIPCAATADPPFACDVNNARQLAKMPALCVELKRILEQENEDDNGEPTPILVWNEDICASAFMVREMQRVHRGIVRKDTSRVMRRDRAEGVAEMSNELVEAAP